MYDHHYDVDPDSPILRNDSDEDDDDDDDDDDNGVFCNSTVIEGQLYQCVEATSAQCCRKKTDNPKKVLIVGAGISGLAAAYELKRSGHKVSHIQGVPKVT
jgi:NADPH-dependent 2,4-dienoyl-CoA reductase/sulfur reductase-like enzyme